MIKILLALGLVFSSVNYEDEIQEPQVSEQASEEVKESESVVDDEDYFKGQIDKLLEDSEVKKVISDAVEEKLKSVIEKYTDENTANNIVGWIINVISMIGMIGLLILSIKRKGGISIEDVKEITSKEIKDANVKEDLVKIENEVNKRLDVIVKALVLAQDKTAQSKLALLELLNTPESKTIAENIEKLEEVKEEAVKVVKEDYKNIF